MPRRSASWRSAAYSASGSLILVRTMATQGSCVQTYLGSLVGRIIGRRPVRWGFGSLWQQAAGGVAALELAVGVAGDGPSLVVHLVVTAAAHRDQVLEVGGSAVHPMHEVVDLSAPEWGGAPAERTGLILEGEGGAWAGDATR